MDMSQAKGLVGAKSALVGAKKIQSNSGDSVTKVQGLGLWRDPGDQ